MRRREALSKPYCRGIGLGTLLTVLFAVAAQGQSFTWTGTAGTLWSDAANWGGTGLPAAGNTAVFAGGTTNTTGIDVGSGVTVAAISYTSAATTVNYTITTGNSLTVAGDGSIVAAARSSGSAREHTIGVPVTFAGNVSLGNNNNTGASGSPDRLTISGPITGSGTVTITSTAGASRAPVGISGSNAATFNGSWDITTGWLDVRSLGALGSGTTTLNGGKIRFSITNVTSPFSVNSGTIETLSGTYAGTMTVNANSTASISSGGGNSPTWSGQIAGGTTSNLDILHGNIGTFTFSGSGSNTLAGLTRFTTGGIYVFNKSGGATALAGNLTVRPTPSGQDARVRWNASNQVADTAVITLEPTHALALAQLRLNGQSDTIGGLVSAGVGTMVVENESGAANTGTLTVSIPTGVTRTFAGVMRNGDGAGTDGVFAFGKTGLGTQVLSGTNAYTGATTISGGTLLVNGTHTGGAAYAVSAGGTLGGSGSLTAAVNASGTVAPGQSIESLATGAISFLSGSSFAYEFDSSLVTGDLLASAGGLSILSGTTLSLLDLGSGTLPTDGSVKLTLISYAGSWNSGVFDYQGSPLANLNSFSVGGNEWQIRYDDTTGGGNFTADQSGATGFVTITAVPEPAGMLGAAAGLGLAAAFLRRFSISRDRSVSR